VATSALFEFVSLRIRLIHKLSISSSFPLIPPAATLVGSGNNDGGRDENVDQR
jgi:hypothetical protein